MKEIKSSGLSDSSKRRIKLPPQESASDTSNWENRNIAAPYTDPETKEHTVREFEFIRPEENTLTLAQIKKLEAQKRNKKANE